MINFYASINAGEPVEMMTRQAGGRYSMAAPLRIDRYYADLAIDTSLNSLAIYASLPLKDVVDDSAIRAAYFGCAPLACRLKTKRWVLTGKFIVSDYRYAGLPVDTDESGLKGGVEFAIELHSHGPLIESRLQPKP